MLLASWNGKGLYYDLCMQWLHMLPECTAIIYDQKLMIFNVCILGHMASFIAVLLVLFTLHSKAYKHLMESEFAAN